MVISSCNTITSKTHEELLSHGTSLFPLACYHDKLAIEAVPWHWHEEFELVVVIQGQCQIAIDTEKFILNQGEGFFINSGILHAAWDSFQSDCQFHSLVFHPRLVGGSLDSIFFHKYIQPLMQNNEAKFALFKDDDSIQSMLLKTIETIWQSCANEEESFEFIVRNHLSKIFIYLTRDTPVFKAQQSLKTAVHAKRLKSMLNCIHEKFSEVLTLEEIAKSAQISESECLRCFKKTIGTTPINYLKQYRLEKSADYLLTTNFKIVEICFMCGFQEMSYFSKSFKEVKGMTPSEFRKKR